MFEITHQNTFVKFAFCRITSVHLHPKKMKLRYIYFLWLLWVGCAAENDSKSAAIVLPKTYRALDTMLPCFKSQCESPDSTQYIHLKYFFYKGKDGNIYEKRYMLDGVDSCCRSQAYYESQLGSGFDSVRKSIKEVLHLQTYRELEPSIYSKDKFHIYGTVDNSDGGFRYVLKEADAATFQCLDSTFWWGMDQYHVFYRGDLVKGLSPRHLKALKVVVSHPELDHVPTVHGKTSYVKNDYQVFFQHKPVSKADARSFKVVDSIPFDAFDKYRRYKEGIPIDSIQ